jgi:endoglucanase
MARPSLSWAPRLALLAICMLFVFSGPAHAALSIQVQGNHLVDAQAQPLRLLGVNFSGAEYACIQNKGIWSGQADEATIAAMAAWHVNAVRIPLNEDCWLGINAAPAAYSGAAYQQAIHEFVQKLHQAGIYAILDLHWNAPGSEQAMGLQPMADLDHSLDFWRSVAASFREDPAVLFDLYSEPHDINWECWLEGCTLSTPEGGSWRTAGMQSLVDAVRSQGATQPLLLGGVEWANDLSGWQTHLPIDSQHQLVASVHIYPNNPCNSSECWSKAVAAVARVHPVVAGELGEFDCEHSFIDGFMKWADANGVSYLGWSWNTYDCASGPSLIASADGTPTAFGAGLHTHLLLTSPSTVNEPPPETPPSVEEPPPPPIPPPPPAPPSPSSPETPPPIAAPPPAAVPPPAPAAAAAPSPSPPRHQAARKHKVKKHRARRGVSRVAARRRLHRDVTKTSKAPAKKSSL